MTKKVDTWMPLLVDKYLGDTGHLTTEQHGAYLLLLMHMWKKDGRLPSDEKQLRPITRLGPSQWRGSRDILLEFFRPTEDGSGLTQKRLSEELARSKLLTESKAEAGTKGAAKRWRKDGRANGTASGTAIADGSQTAWQTGAYTPPPTPKISTTEHAPRSFPRALEEPICEALRAAGIGNADPGHTGLTMLLDAGATEAEFVGAVPKALGKNDPFEYLLAMVQGRRRDAALASEGLLRGPMQADGKPWHETRPGIEAKAKELGVPGWDQDAFEHGRGERFDQWAQRVYAAAGHEPRSVQ